MFTHHSGIFALGNTRLTFYHPAGAFYLQDVNADGNELSDTIMLFAYLLRATKPPEPGKSCLTTISSVNELPGLTDLGRETAQRVLGSFLPLLFVVNCSHEKSRPGVDWQHIKNELTPKERAFLSDWLNRPKDFDMEWFRDQDQKEEPVIEQKQAKAPRIHKHNTGPQQRSIHDPAPARLTELNPEDI